MTSATHEPHGTRPRALLAIAVGFAALAVMHVLVSEGVMAVNFTTGNKEFKVYSNYVQGVYGGGYLDATTKASGPQTGAAEIGFKTASLAGLCLITTDDLLGMGAHSMVITGGVPVRSSFDATQLTTTDGAGAPIHLDAEGMLTGTSLSDAVTMTDMFMNTSQISAFGNRFAGMNLGQSADGVGPATGLTFAHDKAGSGPKAGNLGLSAIHMNLSGLVSSSHGIELAGQVKLPGLRIRTVAGEATQSDCATPAP